MALGRLAEEHPDAILLDLMMPEMDGFEFVDTLRRNDAGPAIPIVVITARTLSDSERRRLNGGVERVVQKHALDAEALLAEVRRVTAS